MKITKRVAERINNDFSILNEKFKKEKNFNKILEERLSNLAIIETLTKRVRDSIHTINYWIFWELKGKGILEEFCLKTACKLYAIGFNNENELKYLIKKELRG